VFFFQNSRSPVRMPITIILFVIVCIVSFSFCIYIYRVSNILIQVNRPTLLVIGRERVCNKAKARNCILYSIYSVSINIGRILDKRCILYFGLYNFSVQRNPCVGISK